MIKRVENVRRKNAAKKKQPKPQPCWVEAFMILLLHKNAMLQEKLDGKPGANAQLRVTLADLEKFEQLKGNNQTLMSFDPETQTVTITAPEMVLPEKIATPKIITEL